MIQNDIAKSELAKFAFGLKSFGMATASPLLVGRQQRWCDVASWWDAKSKIVTVSVCIAPYLGAEMSFWAGFSSLAPDPIARLVDVYRAHHSDKTIPGIVSEHWDSEVKLKLAQRRMLAASGGVAQEGYGPERYNWFGIYLPLNGDGADRAYDFVTGVMAAHPQALRASKPGPTEREARRKERTSQGKFRTDQMKLWGSACVVTGSRVEAALQASHIVPFQVDKSEEMRKSPDNGLLLTATLHLLFDDGLISFADDGAMLSKLLTTESKRLGLDRPLGIKPPLNDLQRRNLTKHRKKTRLRVTRLVLTNR